MGLNAASLAVVLAAAGPTAAVAAGNGPDILKDKCGECHSPVGDGWSRISEQRKTPEGWLMTIARMQTVHGLKLDDAERRSIVKHLADTQGLAPAEAKPFRYVLERQPNVVEKHANNFVAEMCARCHTEARVALQRRTADEWKSLVHFHLGQFPSIEYHSLSRDRAWFSLANDTMAPYLAKTYPLKSAAWSKWLAAPKADFSGEWNVAGRIPGQGDFTGTMAVKQTAADRYEVLLNGRYADGSSLKASGNALVYTGYEWRAKLKADGRSFEQVLAADGDRLDGRMYAAERDEDGMNFSAVRSSEAAILSVSPSYLKAGSTAQVRIWGSGLDGAVSLGKGVTIGKVISASPSEMVVEATAAAARGASSSTVSVGTVKSALPFVVYDKVARLQVEPSYAVARVGGNGATPKMGSHFAAIAYAAGKDGKAGTQDDVRIGAVPATFSAEPFDETAANDKDHVFAGRMGSDGRFEPAEAGLNPARKFQTNNAGNLKAVASYSEDGKTVRGEGRLIVTVQRWNNPPIH